MNTTTTLTPSKPEASPPPVVSLEVLKERIHALDRYLTEQIISRDRAISVGITAMDRRLDSMNEFRDTLRDQASRFITRDEHAASISPQEREIDTLKALLANAMMRLENLEKALISGNALVDKRIDALSDLHSNDLILRHEARSIIERLEGDVKRAAIRSEVTPVLERHDGRIQRLEDIQRANNDNGNGNEHVSANKTAKLREIDSKIAPMIWGFVTMTLVNGLFSWWLVNYSIVH